MAEEQTGGAAADNNLTAARHGEGMALRDTGEHAITAAEGGVGPTGAHHPDPSVFGLNGTVWVSIAMAVFLGVLVWKRVPALIVGGLDKQIAAIRARLEEAKQLRAEAEALRDEYALKIGRGRVPAMIRFREGQWAAGQGRGDAPNLPPPSRMAEERSPPRGGRDPGSCAKVRDSAARPRDDHRQKHDAAGQVDRNRYPRGPRRPTEPRFDEFKMRSPDVRGGILLWTTGDWSARVGDDYRFPDYRFYRSPVSLRLGLAALVHCWPGASLGGQAPREYTRCARRKVMNRLGLSRAGDALRSP